MASGLDALEIALRVLGCGRGDKVLTTSVSAFATNVAILKLGAVPVFVDTDRLALWISRRRKRLSRRQSCNRATVTSIIRVFSSDKLAYGLKIDTSPQG